MDSTKKGNKLEDKFYRYLLDQQERGELVYGLYVSEVCKIYKRKGYYCRERGANVEFDVVIEIFQKGRSEPFQYVVFECKNYDGSIPEACVTDFSDKLTRVFKHNAKGVLVVSSRLQSGADRLARSRALGIIKYDENGLEVVADRKGRNFLESGFVRSQIFWRERPAKSLKFSACYGGRFFGTIAHFLRGIEPRLAANDDLKVGNTRLSVPYLSVEHIERAAQELLKKAGYESGPVNLEALCSFLSIELRFNYRMMRDEDGAPILGSANFDRRLIELNAHGDSNRERFTLGHEIGHFFLGHDRYLRSEAIVEKDLFSNVTSVESFAYERFEFQANCFSSNVILPSHVFRAAIAIARTELDIRDRGHGYIFVDDQPCNFVPYYKLLDKISGYFEVSRQAIEIKLNNMGFLNDQRIGRQPFAPMDLLASAVSPFPL